MKNRIVTAAVAVPVLALCLFLLPEVVTSLLIGACSACAAWELLYNTRIIKNPRLCLYSCAMAAFVPLWFSFGMSTIVLNFAVLAFFCLLFAECMVGGMHLRFEKLAACMACGLVLPYMFSAVVRLLNGEYGRWYVAIPFIIAFISDSGAYFVGKHFGNTKMSPRISPNKTWEGLFGGIIASVAAMLLFTFLFDLGTGLRVSYLIAVVYAILGAFIGAFGDLCFSVIKRQTGIKDYGRALPGHGGILDRFDSFLTICLLIEILTVLLPLGIE